MNISKKLFERNNGLCELCNENSCTIDYLVTPKQEIVTENLVALCEACLTKIGEKQQGNYWRCLEGSIWNEHESVKALSFRILQAYKEENWVQDVLSSIELEEITINWALSSFAKEDVHFDAFGNQLLNGDNVVLTQALNVKGTSFSAAKGTIVKKIRLVANNIEQIEGKINEQTIVILTKYVKKA